MLTISPKQFFLITNTSIYSCIKPFTNGSQIVSYGCECCDINLAFIHEKKTQPALVLALLYNNHLKPYSSMKF